jgi:hypothetical protein
MSEIGVIYVFPSTSGKLMCLPASEFLAREGPGTLVVLPGNGNQLVTKEARPFDWQNKDKPA